MSVARETRDTAFDPAVNMARQSLYRFAALCLLDPRAGSWQRLTALADQPLLAEAAALIRGLPEAVPAELARGERPLAALVPQHVLDRLPRSRQALNDEYERTFGLLVSAGCPPYETEYINNKFTFQRSNALADVAGFYRAFGLTRSPGHPERHDHIVPQLEFMAFLAGLERRAAGAALASGVRTEPELICRRAQQRFLQEHLAWWAPALARLLGKENAGGFYAAVGVFLAAWIPAERALLDVPPPPQQARPSPLERPEACEGCQLV